MRFRKALPSSEDIQIGNEKAIDQHSAGACRAKENDHRCPKPIKLRPKVRAKPKDFHGKGTAGLAGGDHQVEQFLASKGIERNSSKWIEMASLQMIRSMANDWAKAD